MIRDGYSRRLQAERERADLVERWRIYPPQVQHYLMTLLHHHGLRTAQLVTEAVEYVQQQDSPAVEQGAVSAGESSPSLQPPGASRCLYQGPGRPFYSPGRGFDADMHNGMLLPP